MTTTSTMVKPTTENAACPGTKNKQTICEGCKILFPSRSSVFKHLKDTNGACLSKQGYDDFCLYLEQTQREKVLLLYGYAIERNDAVVRSGDDAARILLGTLGAKDAKYTRSYSHLSRASDLVRQDQGTGAVTEVLSTLLPPILSAIPDWIQQTNDKLPKSIRIFGRIMAPVKRFNAEMYVSHRRSEYILPLDCFYQAAQYGSFETFCERFDSFGDGQDNGRPSLDTILYLFRIKKIMQSLQTRTVALDPSTPVKVQEKETKTSKGRRDNESNDINTKPAAPKSSSKKVLKRRRFHNFTPKAMAHEALVNRRLDRCYHRATIRPNGSKRPFMVMSLSADMFLTGQVQRVVGLVVALSRGVVDTDFVDCVFDTDYPHLVPTPPAPGFAAYMAESGYNLWEGKAQAVLMPRQCDKFADGWNDAVTLKHVNEWKQHIRRGICQQWEEHVDTQGRLVSVQEWIERVLEPWAQKARQQLDHYRKWKQEQAGKNTSLPAQVETTDPLPPLSSLDKTVPRLYERVLYLLREADQSGQWPTTSTKRQTVMVSTALDESEKGVASNVSSQNKQRSSSAYIYREGEGGASGSFTVGAFPGGQPKSNEEFKDLMKAAFDLEVALRPDRESSSTIAINRNAQFRPHTDSGAGAGQSTSLIVGMGDYVGGDLVLEGERQDIRYQAVEFNGWKQRHWTMPFKGERFSLVWFTPKGCEGIRGTDLCKDM